MLFLERVYHKETEDVSKLISNNSILVSVIIVSRNSKDMIRRCLDSVFKQTYKDIEIVVVDSSDDGTEKIIEDYQKRARGPFNIIRQEPLGVGIARNTGIENSNGEVLIGVDTDCWIDEDFVEKTIESFSKSDRVLSVYTDKIQLTPSKIFPKLADLYERVMYHDGAVKIKSEKISTYVVRKKIFDLIGLYDPNLKSGEDVELLNRLINKKGELSKQGFKFESALNTYYYEEKQGLGFFEYYNRCIWYGEALANIQYIKSDIINNLMKIVIGLYFSIILPLTIFAAFMWLGCEYIGIALIPLFIIFCYILIKSIYIGKFAWLVILMPVLLVYKSVFIFIGFVKALW